MKKEIVSGVVATVMGGIILWAILPHNTNVNTTKAGGVVSNTPSFVISSVNSSGSQAINDSSVFEVPEVSFPGVSTTAFTEKADIFLQGSNNNLYVGSSNSGDEVFPIVIQGSNLERKIFVSNREKIYLSIMGSNNDIQIEKSIFSKISVNELGSNNEVIGVP